MASWRGVGPSFWAPSTSQAFRWLLIPRLLSAFFMHISDCDETFNYWEPVREEGRALSDVRRQLPELRCALACLLGSVRRARIADGRGCNNYLSSYTHVWISLSTHAQKFPSLNRY